MNATNQTENATVVPTVTKLRESCDRCLVAKVKCSRTRPVCTRCLASGATCGYSPSARAGRKSRNPTASEPSKASTRFEKTSALSPPPTPSSFLHPMHPMLDSQDCPIGHSNNGIFHNSTSNLSHEDANQRPSGMENKVRTTQGGIEIADCYSTPPFDDGLGDAFLRFPSQAYLQNTNPTTPLSTNSNSQNSANPTLMASEPPYLLSPSFQLPVDLMSYGQASSSHSTLSPEAFALQEIGPRAPFTPDGGTQFTCDCFALCLQALQTLHNHSRVPESTQPGGLPFDVVLTINREAMRGCAGILDCAKCVSKSGNSISTMLLATIFGKIISLYGAACFFRFGLSTDNQDVVKLAFGAYTPTGEDRRMLEMEIILLELRKVESILLAYQERFRNVQAEKDETSVYNALTCYLDKNLHYILDFLHARCSTST